MQKKRNAKGEGQMINKVYMGRGECKLYYKISFFFVRLILAVILPISRSTPPPKVLVFANAVALEDQQTKKDAKKTPK